MGANIDPLQITLVNSGALIDRYDQRLRKSSVTFEQLHAITTEAACTLSPTELKKLYSVVGEWADEEFEGIFKRAAPIWSQFKFGKVPEYQNHYISEKARLYTSTSTSLEKKGFLIFFGGAGRQAGAVHCRILSLLPPDRFDVLFLRRNAPSDYRNGIPGVADGMRATCESIAHHFPRENYTGVGCFGFCMGGFWALRAAMMLRADIGVSVSGRFSRKSGAQTDYDQMVDPVSLFSEESLNPRLFSFYGDKTPLVGENARLFQSAYPSVELHPIPDTKEKSVYPVMAARRQLKPFFNTFSKAVLSPEEEIVWPI